MNLQVLWPTVFKYYVYLKHHSFTCLEPLQNCSSNSKETSDGGDSMDFQGHDDQCSVSTEEDHVMHILSWYSMMENRCACLCSA